HQANRTPYVDFKSPYNTRIHVGLPPGPIASPGLSALKAVAHPATGDYLYFVSGDDNKTYFSKTLEQHELNTRLHCQANCSLF
ncbi:MAG: endolytic transglycosylase MltG, partial [Candidatus Saccharimonadales bacterium]